MLKNFIFHSVLHYHYHYHFSQPEVPIDPPSKRSMTREQHQSSRKVEEIGNSKENGKIIVIEDDEELVEIVKSKEKGKMIVIEDDEEVEDFIDVELYEDLHKMQNPSTEDALSDDDDWIKSSGDSPQNPIHVSLDPLTSDVTRKQSHKRKHATPVTTPLPPQGTTLGNSPHSPIGRGTKRGRGRGRGRGKGQTIDITIMPPTPLLSSQKPLKKIPATNATTKQSRKIKHTTSVTTPLQSSEDHVVEPTQIPYSSTSVTETTTAKKNYMRARNPKAAKKLFPGTPKPIAGSPLFAPCIPSELHEFCIDHVNPLGDGNCGFRAYSLCLGRMEEQWPKMRSELIENVFLNYKFYLKFLGESEPQNMVNTLSWYCTTLSAPTSHWYQHYPCFAVFANTHSCVLVFLSLEHCWTFPPKKALSTYPPVFAIAYVESNHYIKLDMADGYPIPPIHPQYLHHVSAEIQKTWLETLGPRIQAFQKLKVKGLLRLPDIWCKYDLMGTPVKWSGF